MRLIRCNVICYAPNTVSKEAVYIAVGIREGCSTELYIEYSEYRSSEINV